jgi:hypothetical protein
MNINPLPNMRPFMDAQASFRDPFETLFRGPSSKVGALDDWQMHGGPKKQMISTYDMTMIAGLAALTYYVTPDNKAKTALGVGIGYLLLKPLAKQIADSQGSSSRTY